MLYANLCLFLRKQKGLFGSNMYCRMALQLLGILERDERQLYASSSLFVSADYGKTPTIQPSKALLQ